MYSSISPCWTNMASAFFRYSYTHSFGNRIPVIDILVLAMPLLQSVSDLWGLLPIISHSSISYRHAYGFAQVKLGYLSHVLGIYNTPRFRN